MARTLIERICAPDLTAADEAAGDGKIIVHGITSMLLIQRKGWRSDTNTMYALTTAQNNQLGQIIDLYNAAVDKAEFIKLFEAMCWLSESGTDTQYVTWTTFRQMLRDEVTRLGGTLP